MTLVLNKFKGYKEIKQIRVCTPPRASRVEGGTSKAQNSADKGVAKELLVGGVTPLKQMSCLHIHE